MFVVHSSTIIDEMHGYNMLMTIPAVTAHTLCHAHAALLMPQSTFSCMGGSPVAYSLDVLYKHTALIELSIRHA